MLPEFIPKRTHPSGRDYEGHVLDLCTHWVRKFEFRPGLAFLCVFFATARHRTWLPPPQIRRLRLGLVPRADGMLTVNE